MQTMIDTDSFGRVPQVLYHKWRRFNVTPAEHWDLEVLFKDDWKGMMQFVEDHTTDGMYRAPWPFPYPNGGNF